MTEPPEFVKRRRFDRQNITALFGARRRQAWAATAEVAGLALVTAAAVLVTVPLGLAVGGVALFAVGFFGLAS